MDFPRVPDTMLRFPPLRNPMETNDFHAEWSLPVPSNDVKPANTKDQVEESREGLPEWAVAINADVHQG